WHRRQQGRAASLQERRRRLQFAPVQAGGKKPLLFHFPRARAAAVRMLFDGVFLLRRQFAVVVQRNEGGNRLAVHVKSPNTERIFWVARNRQFFAASSVVPRISPILR